VNAADAPPEILGRLRTVCLGLPEANEEAAWVVPRWRIRSRAFVHLVVIDVG